MNKKRLWPLGFRKFHLTIVVVTVLCSLFTGCTSPTLQKKIDSTTITTTSETRKPTLASQIVPTRTKTPVDPNLSQPPTVISATIRPTEVRSPMIETGYQLIKPGQHLTYFEFDNEGSVNVVTKDGEIHVLSSHLADILAISGNSRYFLFEDFVYDSIKQIRVDFLRRKSCPVGVGALSWDGKFVASICPEYQMAILSADRGWTALNGNHLTDEQPDYPTWSPNGRQIAYVICNGGQKTSDDSGVYIINVEACLDGNHECEVDPQGPYMSATCPNYISWSPDGQSITSVDDELRVANINTKQEKTLVENKVGTGLMHGVAWSPDGQWIGYSVDNANSNEGFSSLYIISAQGGEPMLINPKTKSQVWGWLNVIPIFAIGNEYTVSIIGEGKTLYAESTETSQIVSTLLTGDIVHIVDGPREAEQQIWWKVQAGTSIGWVIENYDWFTVVNSNDSGAE